MAIRGEHFELSLDDLPGPAQTSFIKDIQEKPSSGAAKPPSAPSVSGFPQPKKRASLFKRSREGSSTNNNSSKSKAENTAVTFSHDSSHQQSQSSQLPSTTTKDAWELERERVDQENANLLEKMTLEEIEQSRRELFEGLGSDLLNKFLNRKTTGGVIDQTLSPCEKAGGYVKTEAFPEKEDSRIKETRAPSKSVRFQENSQDVVKVMEDIQNDVLPAPASVHFPRPNTDRSVIPDPDPESPEFLERLHSKYFPDLPVDPTKMAWMQPVKEEEDAQTYHPSLESVSGAALRFDFKGRLLPPRTALQMPTHLGLHHHAHAPGAAGYTIPELAHLARSTFPPQRCMAMQTLGRILYRLGVGEFGEELSPALWTLVDEGRVIEGLQEAASKESGHIGVKTYATEALWNWRMGGGNKWKVE